MKTQNFILLQLFSLFLFVPAMAMDSSSSESTNSFDALCQAAKEINTQEAKHQKALEDYKDTIQSIILVNSDLQTAYDSKTPPYIAICEDNRTRLYKQKQEIEKLIPEYFHVSNAQLAPLTATQYIDLSSASESSPLASKRNQNKSAQRVLTFNVGQKPPLTPDKSSSKASQSIAGIAFSSNSTLTTGKRKFPELSKSPELSKNPKTSAAYFAQFCLATLEN